MIEIDNKNVQLFCRTCLNELKTSNAVAPEKFDINENMISKWILDCTSLMVKNNDKFPKYICNQCYQRLKLFNDFRAMSHHSMSILQSILNLNTKDDMGEVCNDNSLCSTSPFHSNDVNKQDNKEELGDKNLVMVKLFELERMLVEPNDDKIDKEPETQTSSQLNDTLAMDNCTAEQETTETDEIDSRRRIRRDTIASKRQKKNNVVSGVRCCIQNCKRSKRHDKIKLFKFPRADLVMGRVWREKCNIPKWEYYKNLNICDRHFDISSIGKKFLRNGALPTLFLDESEKVCIKEENWDPENESVFNVNKRNIGDNDDSKKLSSVPALSTLASSFKKVCSLCQKCFSKEFLLEAHILQVHPGEKKSFICKYCTLAFHTNAVFEHHLKNTHEEAWYHNQDDNSQQEFLDFSISSQLYMYTLYFNYITISFSLADSIHDFYPLVKNM